MGKDDIVNTVPNPSELLTKTESRTLPDVLPDPRSNTERCCGKYFETNGQKYRQRSTSRTCAEHDYRNRPVVTSNRLTSWRFPAGTVSISNRHHRTQTVDEFT